MEKPSEKKDAEAKSGESNSPPPKKSEEKKSESKESESPTASAVKKPLEMIQNVANTVRSGLGNLLKLLFYIAAGTFLAIAIWRYRQQIMQAISDILRMLREMFGGRRTSADGAEEEKAASGAATAELFRVSRSVSYRAAGADAAGGVGSVYVCGI